MIPAALVRNAANSLDGDELDEALFYLFEDHLQQRLEQIGRVRTWETLNQQEIAEGFRRFLSAKLSDLGDEPNQPTRDHHRQLRNRHFGDALQQLRKIWAECLQEAAALPHQV